MTDSDAAGFKIRHFVTGLVGAEHVLQAYVPAIAGKESRKAEPGKEGLLGVEGVSDDLIVQGLETALASKTACQQKRPSRAPSRTPICTTGASPARPTAPRTAGCFAPPRSAAAVEQKELLQVLNTLYTYDALNAEIKSYKNCPEPCKWFRAFYTRVTRSDFQFSNSAIHSVLQASLGMRQSPRGDSVTEPTFGPSGRQLRLNCWAKKRR